MEQEKQNLYLRVPQELKERLERAAERMGLSVNAFILQALWGVVKDGGDAM